MKIVLDTKEVVAELYDRNYNKTEGKLLILRLRNNERDAAMAYATLNALRYALESLNLYDFIEPMFVPGEKNQIQVQIYINLSKFNRNEA